ncbi:MAG: barstar family protein [Desulfuromonadales bacterium]|nr:barstar family protein [Desulfuromonadales bacterium]
MPVKKTTCIIDGRNVRSLEEFYGELSRQLPFPPTFGNNLDALWDVLTTDIAGSLRIVWNGAETSHRAMGKDFETVVALLRDVGKERKDFSVTIQE